jgi:hypothetical protein
MFYKGICVIKNTKQQFQKKGIFMGDLRGM